MNDKKYRREYYKKNKEKLRLAAIAYQLANPKKIAKQRRKAGKKYYKKNRDKRLEKSKKYNKETSEFRKIRRELINKMSAEELLKTVGYYETET
jgi:hypothetical protein